MLRAKKTIFTVANELGRYSLLYFLLAKTAKKLIPYLSLELSVNLSAYR